MSKVWLWDCWFARVGSAYHMFQLAAPQSQSSEERHHNATVRHYESRDLLQWQDKGEVLRPGPGWDDVAIWTGSVIFRDDRYLMYYTGRCKEEFWLQKIGLAIAENSALTSWKKYDENPVMVADQKLYYASAKLADTGSPYAFRDPFAFQDPSSGKHYLAFAGHTGPNPYSACIGLADASDPLHPVLLPPLCAPGRYAEMECPQVVFMAGWVYLFFSVMKDKYSPEWRKQVSPLEGGLHCYVASSLAGPFNPALSGGLILDKGRSEYAHAVAFQEGSNVTLVGFNNFNRNGDFQGGAAEPLQLRLEDGKVDLII
jgi:sucrose-6-phosphate hydrolase SacC (GH32 family)